MAGSRERARIGARRYSVLLALPAARRPVVASAVSSLAIGMYALASLRLASRQCAAWGHPVTTGLPTIDVFFTSAAMEPDDAANHYSEKLASLPGIGTRYAAPARQPVTRGLPVPVAGHPARWAATTTTAWG